MLEILSRHTPLLLQIILFSIMLGMGMTLSLKDFKRVGKYPLAIVIGMVNQIVLLPLVGLAILKLIPLEAAFAVGLMVVAASPGGATSNLISHLSRGDTALSISMTAVSSIITILSIPLIINFSLGFIMGDAEATVKLDVWRTIIGIIKLTAAPVIIGMIIKEKFPQLVQNIGKIIAWGSGVVIIIALLLMVNKLAEVGDVWSFVKVCFLPVLLLNLVTMGIGYGSARLLKLKAPQAISISIESGMQNNVLGMAIATSPAMLNNPLMAAPAGVYGIVMCATGVLFIFIFRKLVQ